MKNILIYVFVVSFLFVCNVYAEDVTTVEAESADISENLDLEAVASVFGESKDLEDFEKRLNDPKTQISNLDLNEDDEVDYLRVIETGEGDTHVVTIQAVLGKDQFQDVATIDVEKKGKETQVQVVGDVYMYGPSYIVEPVYVHPPVIFVWFWGPYYRPWRSPFYWGFYPPYYRPWHPFARHRYRANIDIHIERNTYIHTNKRKSDVADRLQKEHRRNDFAQKHPDRSFAKRNEGLKNKQGVKQARDKSAVKSKVSNKVSTGKKVQKDWQPANKRTGTSNKVSKVNKSTPAIAKDRQKLSTARKSNSKDRVKSSSPNKSRQQIGRPSPNRASKAASGAKARARKR